MTTEAADPVGPLEVSRTSRRVTVLDRLQTEALDRLDAEVLIREARQRQRKRRLSIGAVLLVVALGTGIWATSGGGPASGPPSSANKLGRTRSPGTSGSARKGARSGALAIKRANVLSGVWCSAANSCIAVGSYYVGELHPQPLVEQWNGRSWVLGHPNELSCNTVVDCSARWSILPDSHGYVSCASTRFCMAVGGTIAEYWNGGQWRRTLMVEPATTAVSCVTSRFCMAVGGYETGVCAMPCSTYRALLRVAVWDGLRWRNVPIRNPAKNNSLTSVSCTSPTACTAVGDYYSASGMATLVERWNGAAWAIRRTPNPSGTGYNALSAVSCASAEACTAVGNVNGGIPFAESWKGGGWKIESMPEPTSVEPDSEFNGVSCPSSSACAAVGNDGTATLAETWRANIWVIDATSNPAFR